MTNPKEKKTGPGDGKRKPVVFAGHGSPMNAIEDNRFSRGFAGLAELVPRPKAVLAISAHWYTYGTFLTGEAAPRTIHDFSGFPRALYEIEYPAPGDPALAETTRSLLGTGRASLRTDWGLDHGTWSVLRKMFPDADVPVAQLSIDRRLPPAEHLALARPLASLRDAGVLIFASGNVVHNLADALGRMQSGAVETPDWASRFDERVAGCLTRRDTEALAGLWPDTPDGRRAHPSPDHWLPLLYAYAATDDADDVRFPTTGFDLGSISMRNVVFG